MEWCYTRMWGVLPCYSPYAWSGNNWEVLVQIYILLVGKKEAHDRERDTRATDLYYKKR